MISQTAIEERLKLFNKALDVWSKNPTIPDWLQKDMRTLLDDSGSIDLMTYPTSKPELEPKPIEPRMKTVDQTMNFLYGENWQPRSDPEHQEAKLQSLIECVNQLVEKSNKDADAINGFLKSAGETKWKV